jgi:hypothetical protein
MPREETPVAPRRLVEAIENGADLGVVERVHHAQMLRCNVRLFKGAARNPRGHPPEAGGSGRRASSVQYVADRCGGVLEIGLAVAGGHTAA